MIRSAASKVMWVGRATVFLVGLAVILALLFGVAATALAGTGVGDTFNLGKVNSVNKISSLIGSTSSAMLKIDNNGTGPALNLQVEPGKQPLTVNSERKVARLNADKVDGSDAPLWAVVNANGTVDRSKGLTGIVRVGFGFYQLTFNRDVSSCAFSATLDEAVSGQISAYRGFQDAANTVRVFTMNSSGTGTEHPYYLVVFC